MESQIMFKIDAKDKEIIKEAAKLIGLKIGSFTRSTALKDAREILIKNQTNLN